MRVIDFNTLTQPTLVLRMQDEQKTVIHVTAPTLNLVNELTNNAAQLEKALSGTDAETRPLVYGLAARLISCNQDGVVITAEELPIKYGMSQVALRIFFEEYVEFIGDINNAKN